MAVVPGPRPRSSPAVGSVVATHFDDPIRLAYASHADYHCWFVAWWHEVGFESLQPPDEGSRDHYCPASNLVWFLRATTACEDCGVLLGSKANGDSTIRKLLLPYRSRWCWR